MAEEQFPMGPMEPPVPAQMGKKQESMAGTEVGDVNDKLNMLSARVRISEERYNDIRKKILVIEQNMLSNHRKAMDEVKVLNSEFTDLKRKIVEVEDRIIAIIKELKLTARKEDIDVLRRYIELWDPTKFVHIDNFERMLDEWDKGEKVLKESSAQSEEKE